MFYFLALASALGYAINSLVYLPYSRKYSPFAVATIRQTSLIVLFAPFLFLVDWGSLVWTWDVIVTSLTPLIFSPMIMWGMYISTRSIPAGVSYTFTMIRIPIIALLAFFLYDESWGMMDLLGTGIVLSGTLMLSFVGSNHAHLDNRFRRGILFAIMAGVGVTGWVWCVSYLARELDPYLAAYIGEGGGALGFLLLTPFLRKSFHEIPRKVYIKMLPLGIYTLLATGTYAFASTMGSLGVLNVLGQTTIVFTVIGGWIWFREKLSPVQLTAIAIVLLGTVVLSVFG